MGDRGFEVHPPDTSRRDRSSQRHSISVRRSSIDNSTINDRAITNEGTVAVKEGWKGRVYEDFEVGDIYVHPLGRTVLSVDNSWFTLLTQNMNPIHFDHAYAAQTKFGKPLVDSTFTLALVTGQSTIDLSFNVMANLGWDEVRLPNPLFEGDTVYSRSEVLEKRESKSRPNVGIVKVRTTGFKQDGVVVIEFLRTFMVYKRGQVPATAKTCVPEPRR